MNAEQGVLQTPTRDPLIGSLSEAQMDRVLGDWRMTPATLMSRIDPSWIPAKWLQFLSFKIATAIARGSCGLLISAPPRHGKSMLSTIATPLWVLENFPSYNVVVSTYGEELSTDFSRQIRDHIQNNQDILSVRLRADTQRVTNFLTTKGGGLKAVGLRGAITGRGANVFVLDDYIKEPKEAMSATYLEDLWTWWLTVARTRLEPGAVVIILATRWVAKDLHGRIMARQKETGRSFFEYVELPAIYEPTKPDPTGATDVYGKPVKVPDLERTDIIGRKYGDVLFKERYNRESIMDIRTELGTRWFGAMFQQKPEEGTGTIADPAWFKKITMAEAKGMIERAHQLKRTVKFGRYWDMASTANAGDYTTGALASHIKETDITIIWNIHRGQHSPAKAEEAFDKWTKKDELLYDRYTVGMEQEPGSSGKYSIRHFQKLLKEDTENGEGISLTLKEFPATTKKLLNAQPLLAAAEAGKVFIIDDPECDPYYYPQDGGQGWVKDFLLEVEDFPEGAHDDQMDGVSGVYRLLSGKKALSAAVGRKNGADPAKTGENQPDPANIGRNRLGNAENGRKRRSSITFGRI